jgi:hypothetical protein
VYTRGHMSAQEYEARFPYYCRTCGGIGGKKGRGERLPEECPDCFGRRLCGRCAADLPKYKAECPTCGWRAFNAADAIPGGDYV